MTARVHPYGTWTSPISAAAVASGSIALSQTLCEGERVYWVEMRATEAGRHVIVCAERGVRFDLTPPNLSARSRVHEYGGGAFTVRDQVLYFSNDADRCVYAQDIGNARAPAAAHAITRNADMRYADFVFDASRRRLLAVREDHSVADGEPVNSIAAIDAGGSGVEKVLIAGADFYSSPRISSDGGELAWLNWNHPEMPWDACELWLGRFDAQGNVVDRQKVAGGEREAICQPLWTPASARETALYFVSDRDGFWNLYRRRGAIVEALYPAAADFGRAHWVFGQSCLAFLSERELACAYNERGSWRLGVLDIEARRLKSVAVAFTDINYVAARRGRIVCVAGSPSEAESVLEIDPTDGATVILRASSDARIDARYTSAPRAIEFETQDNTIAHAFFYPPVNADFCAPEGEHPPLIVISHGGPTAATATSFSPALQFWTSRGFALLDVNYRGSTGYGRAYRERLNGAWGVADVEDCARGALHVAALGWADRQRLIIRGRSAGGYTTLAALAFRREFRAGASYYGVSDLELLARDTHKFESRYLDRLIGAYPARRDLYVQRSPIHACEEFSAPIIFFQGLEDKVTPPNQTERMVEALRAKRLPVAYLSFAGEQHGFRRAETIQRALEAEWYFYCRIFGLPAPANVAPVAIENL